MKTLDEIKDLIKELKETLKQRYKADVIGIFGSFARGEQKEGSDVDIIVRFHEGATLFDFVGLSLFLEEKLGLKVDIVPQDAIRQELKEKIAKEVVNI